MSKPDPITVTCCACQEKNITFEDGGQVHEKGWSVEENGDGKKFALCPICAKRQDGIDERQRQIMGLPPEKIPPLVRPERIEEKPPLVITNKSNVSVKARFKLVSIDISLGEKIIAGETSDAVELNDDALKALEIDKHYYINLIK